MTKPISGSIVKCPTCRHQHRLSHPRNRNTGGTITNILVFECLKSPNLIIAARDGILLPGFHLITPSSSNPPRIENEPRTNSSQKY